MRNSSVPLSFLVLATSKHLDKLYVKNERGKRRNHGSGTSFAVSQHVGDIEAILGSLAHQLQALCPASNHLLRALADAGGVAQVTLYHGFLVKDSIDFNPQNQLRTFLSETKGAREATILDAIDHLNHMVSVMGIEHVGIGTDFDGDGGIRGCASASELINFTRRLLRQCYTEQQIQMIWGGNFMRVMREVQKHQGEMG